MYRPFFSHQIHTVSAYGSGYKSFSPSPVGKGKIYGIHALSMTCPGRGFF